MHSDNGGHRRPICFFGGWNPCALDAIDLDTTVGFGGGCIMWPMGRRAALPAKLRIVEDLGLTVGTIHSPLVIGGHGRRAIPSATANQAPLGLLAG
jgi:hypothetical protein